MSRTPQTSNWSGTILCPFLQQIGSSNKLIEGMFSLGLGKYFIKIKLTKDYSLDVLEPTNLPMNLTLALSKWVTIRVKTFAEN